MLVLASKYRNGHINKRGLPRFRRMSVKERTFYTACLHDIFVCAGWIAPKKIFTMLNGIEEK